MFRGLKFAYRTVLKLTKELSPSINGCYLDSNLPLCNMTTSIMDSILARPFTGFPCLEEIRDFLANNAESFQKSELYSSSVDAKIIDESLRKSLFRTFEDDELFSLVDNVVGWLNTSDPTFIYQLRRDNITETRYEAGGHFLKHKARVDVCCHLLYVRFINNAFLYSL